MAIINDCLQDSIGKIKIIPNSEKQITKISAGYSLRKRDLMKLKYPNFKE
jgi:hypothetical protein